MAKVRKRLSEKERKKQILICAVKVFAKSNYRAARVADIAAEAGISEALIYKYFPSKKSIFLKILEHMTQRIITFWQEEVDKEPNALEAMRNMVLTYYRRMIKHPDDLKVHFQAVSEIDDPAIFKRLREDHKTYMLFIQNVLKKGIAQKVIRKNLPLDAMTFLLDGGGIIMNMMKLLQFDNEFDEEMVSQIADYLIEFLRA